MKVDFSRFWCYVPDDPCFPITGVSVRNVEAFQVLHTVFLKVRDWNNVVNPGTNVAKFNLGKVKLETCWPAVYHVGCPTRSQGPLVAHVLAVPALLFSWMIAHQSQLLLPPPSPLGKYVPCCSPLVVQCDRCLVLGGHRVAMDTATLGWYSIWWPFHHQAPTPHTHQSMSLKYYYTDR